MKHPLLAIGLGVLAGAAALAAQREDWRRESREPIDLSGGSRVEFSSIPSEAIRGEVEFSVFLPPTYGKTSDTYPVVYFLHGLFNDHTSWTVDHRGDIPALLDDLMARRDLPEMILVHPDGGRSFYTDYRDGSLRYETMVVEEIPRHVETSYRVSKDRGRRAIAGTSMGGYGALKIAMRHPDRYSVAAAHSPIVFPVKNPLAARGDAAANREFQYLAGVFAAVYGEPFDQAYFDANNPLELARRPEIRGLALYFDYGTADRYDERIGMGEGLRMLDRALTEQGVEHSFRSHAGEPHGWALVYAHLSDSLGFIGRHLTQ